MKPRELVARVDRLQKSRGFKLAASAVILVCAVAVILIYAVGRIGAERDAARAGESGQIAQPVDPFELLTPEQQAQLKPEEKAELERLRTMSDLRQKAVDQMLALRTDTPAVVMSTTIVAGLALVVVWIGVGLTTLGLVVVVAAVVLPLNMLGERTIPLVGIECRALSVFLGGVCALALAFSILIEGLKLLLSPPSPILAIAKNVVNEAVRLRVSLVLIVLLIIGLAAVPGLLNDETPLRYRVQSFLQYGTGGAFWIIAVLVLALAVGTVAFEQRDRIIWQTMTKPVAAWEYILGKWIGVMGVAAVLLGVCGAGVFLFTEHLKDQRTIGEVRPYVPADERMQLTEDRRILLFEVLTARKGGRLTYPRPSDEEINQQVESKIEQLKQAGEAETFDSVQGRADLRKEMLDNWRTAYLAIEPGQVEEYTFDGLETVRQRGVPLILRYKINQGSNDPRAQVVVTFAFPNFDPQVLTTVPPGQPMTMQLSPGTIDKDGKLHMAVINGAVDLGGGGVSVPQDQGTISFPPDGLQVTYAVGSFRMNFGRVFLVLWMKLGFLAMVGIAAATFLSFPVACLTAFGIFLMCESSGFLLKALESYKVSDNVGKTIWFNKIVEQATYPIAKTFEFYSTFKPTSYLVEGRLVSWGTVATAAAVLGGISLVLFAGGVLIFRKRELATYSGQ